MRAGIEYGRAATLVIAPVGGQPGVDLTGLRVAFEVKKTSTSQANTATVKVWNLSEATRNRIIQKKMVLILRAGYGESSLLTHLASGVVQRVEHSPQPPDVLTEMELRDGGLGLDEAVFRRAYPSGTRVGKIVDDILGCMPDVSRGALTAEALSMPISSKRCFSGQARVCLDALARAHGFEWSVQDGAAQVVDRTGATGPQTAAIVLSSETGLIGSPTKTQAGCKARSLLQPAIVPGCFIKTESSFCLGYFKALTVTHKGDTHGEEWETETEAKSIDKWVGPGAKLKKGK